MDALVHPMHSTLMGLKISAPVTSHDLIPLYGECNGTSWSAARPALLVVVPIAVQSRQSDGSLPTPVGAGE